VVGASEDLGPERRKGRLDGDEGNGRIFGVGGVLAVSINKAENSVVAQPGGTRPNRFVRRWAQFRSRPMESVAIFFFDVFRVAFSGRGRLSSFVIIFAKKKEKELSDYLNIWEVSRSTYQIFHPTNNQHT
jgi:hypothetical protein